MRYKPFGQKPLGDVGVPDLQELISRRVSEGLFVEYKSEWAPHKIARAVASFANSPGGGTLIVGVTADKLYPVDVQGVEHSGDLEERSVQTIRDSVAPTPAFIPVAVHLGNGRACLIIEVPEGTQPPYIVLRTGAVLERTATSSTPVPLQNRDTLDRLFERGRRGELWAHKEAQERIQSIEYGSASIWTIPAVEGGLGPLSRIFRESFVMSLMNLVQEPIESGAAQKEWRTSQDSVSAIADDSPHYTTSLVVETSGIVKTVWAVMDQSIPMHMIESMLRRVLPLHQEIVEKMLEHRGSVVIASAVNALSAPGVHEGLVRIVQPPVSVQMLSDTGFHDSIVRQTKRARGKLSFEPEEET